MTGNNNEELRKRIEFIKLDSHARESLRSLRPLLAKSVGPALDAFYEQVRRTPETQRFFGNSQHVERAKGLQSRHWETIAEANFDDTYFQKVRAIGETHARLGLEPRWYVGGYALVVEQLIASVLKDGLAGFLGRTNPKLERVTTAVSAMVKAAMLDMELAISIYLEALERKRQQAELEREAAQRNQAAALAALTRALKQLSEGDLTIRLNEALTAEFDELKQDFNSAAANLESMLGTMLNGLSSIDTSVQEVSQATDDLSRRTEQQASNVEQTAAAIAQTSESVKTSALGTVEVSKRATGATEAAQRGGETVASAIQAMTSIEQSSKQIEQIIGVIDELSFQTNLLALNAGVEAARAGEAGRGFSVVASEVRALAQRSAAASKEIRTMITRSTEHVAQGSRLVAETGQALETIIKQVRDISAVIDKIAAGANEQSSALQELSSTAKKLDQITQQNAAMAQEATAATKQLLNETRQLASETHRFTFGSETGHRPNRPRLVRAS